MHHFSRRRFIHRALIALVTLPLARTAGAWSSVKTAKKAVAPPAGQKPLPETDAVASALGYRADAKDVDTKKYPQRAQPDAQNRFCAACANYATANESWGKCQVLNGLVASRGWCGAWVKRSG